MLLLLFFRTLGVFFFVVGALILSDYLVFDSRVTPQSPAAMASGISLLIFGILIIFVTTL